MATSTEHSVHLSIFQLPERTYYYSNQVFQFPSVWNLFIMAQTPMEVNTSTSSTSSSQSHILSPCTTLGNHSGFGQQLYQTISHGKKTPFERNWFTGQGCYFIRRLANNLGEPQRSFAVNAIDRALKFWKAKRVRKPTPLRAPWLLAPNWTRDLRKLLTSHVHSTKQYNTTLQTPSTGIVFTKFPLSWTASATTKKQQHAGLMMNYKFVPVLHYDNIHTNLTRQTNTSSSTEMRFTSPKCPSHRSLQSLYRTRSSRHPRKSTSPCARL